jgi:hypothetical protein
VLTVANTRSDDTRATDSNFGAWVEVAAPGTGITSTLAGGGFGSRSGTSMATPHVAGLAALVKAGCGLPGTPQAVMDRITSTADPIAGTGTEWKYGRINARRATCFPAPQHLRSGSIGASSIQILWTDTTPGETHFQIAYGLSGGPATHSFVVPANTQSFTHFNVPAGARYDYTLRACDGASTDDTCSAWTNNITLESNVKLLTVSRSGKGRVLGPGISCGTGTSNDCSEPMTPGTVVTLSELPYVNSKLGEGWRFDGWRGACQGSRSSVCTFTVNENRTVTAVFVNNNPD